MTSSNTVRAFLAVHVDEAIHAALARLRDELAAIRSDVRWVRNEGLHATLKFLGSVPAEQLEQIRGTLAAVGVQHALCDVRVAGMGVFPSMRRPRVVWVGMHGDALTPLARAVEDAVAPFGFAPERRPFHAHITLGRVNGPRGWPRVEEALKAHWSDDLGICTIDEIVAYRSDLRSGGAVYTKLWSIPLEGGRRGALPCH